MTRGVVRSGIFFGLVFAACMTAGCGSASTNLLEPSASKCEVSATSNTPELPATGGNGTISVSTSRDCPWSASADAAWISLATTSGQGPATMSYSVAPNPAGTTRRGHVSVAARSTSDAAAADANSVVVAQAPAPCRYDVSPSTVNVDAAEHPLSITLTSTDGCAWTARSDSPWVAGIAPPDGVGSATIRATIAANTAETRTGTLAIGGAAVRINQSAAVGPSPPTPPPEPPSPQPPPACSYRLDQTSRSIGRGADEFSVGISAPAECAWSVSTDAPWLSVVDGRIGTGNGIFRLRAAANDGTARTAIVRAATEILTVQQAGSCRFSIRPTSYDAGRGPDDITIGVSADPGCGWTTTTDAAWVRVEAGASGSGNGTVRLTIPENTGPPRTAVVAIAENTFTLRQEGSACTGATIKPRSYHSGPGPDDIRIQVKAAPGCAWTAESPVPWVTLAEGSSGSGNGEVRLRVEANSGPPRSATLTIAGQPFDLRQDGARR